MHLSMMPWSAWCMFSIRPFLTTTCMTNTGMWLSEYVHERLQYNGLHLIAA